MDLKQIRKTVDSWITEDEYPSNPILKVERTSARYFNPCEGMDDEEAKAYWEYIHKTASGEYQMLLSLPKRDEPDFWEVDQHESGNDVMMFNTHNKRHWRLNRIYGRVKDLAITHSCLSNEDGRRNIHQRYIDLVNGEFRNKGIFILKNYQKYKVWMSRHRVIARIEEINSKIRRCKEIWEKYACWE